MCLIFLMLDFYHIFESRPKGSQLIIEEIKVDQRKNVVICFSKRFCHWHCTYSEISQKMTAGNWLFSAKELSWVNKILFWTIWSVAWSCFKELLSFHSMFQMQLPRQILRLFKRCILCFLFWPKPNVNILSLIRTR